MRCRESPLAAAPLPVGESWRFEDFFVARPIEQRFERLPVAVKLCFEIGNPFPMCGIEPAEFGQGCDIRSTELGQTVAILGRVVARDIEEVVTDKDAREVHIGAKTSELRVHVVMVGVQAIELRVNVLRFSRQREHRHHDQEQETSKSDRRNRPGSETHAHLQHVGQTHAVIRSLTRDAGHSHPVKGGEHHHTKPQRHGWAPRQERRTSPINRMVLSEARLLTLWRAQSTKTNKADRGIPIRCRMSGPLTFFALGSIHSTVSSRLSCWPTVGRTGNLGLGAGPSPVDLVGSSRHWSR